ncbi:MAG: penicillin acylase family protein [Calothrix sp. SM1_5_4]|nr:penicillin acylase family protein [Calothrix sp. SM1_5_4]
MRLRILWLPLAAAWVVFLARGFGGVPALGPLFDLGSGIWAHRPHRVDGGRIPGLRQPVHVAWDRAGVPHFFAESEEDLYRAQGFVMASQRLFQMDLSTRSTAGRLSEWVGDRTRKLDEFNVRFGMRDSAERTLRKFLEDRSRE